MIEFNGITYQIWEHKHSDKRYEVGVIINFKQVTGWGKDRDDALTHLRANLKDFNPDAPTTQQRTGYSKFS